MFEFETFYLSPDEYAKISSEINTNYFKYIDKPVSAHFSYGTDGNFFITDSEEYGYC